MKVWAALVTALVLGGCATSRGPSTTELLDRAYAACRETSPNRTEEAKCFTGAELQLMTNFPDPDLLRYKQNLRQSLAEKVDRKQMTQAEADLEYSKGMMQIMSEFDARSSRRSMTAAQYETARAVRSLKPENPCIIPNQRYCF